MCRRISLPYDERICKDWNEQYKLPASNINVSIDARLKDLLLTANASIPETGGQLREFKELIDTVEDSHFLTKEKTAHRPGADRLHKILGKRKFVDYQPLLQSLGAL